MKVRFSFTPLPYRVLPHSTSFNPVIKRITMKFHSTPLYPFLPCYKEDYNEISFLDSVLRLGYPSCPLPCPTEFCCILTCPTPFYLVAPWYKEDYNEISFYPTLPRSTLVQRGLWWNFVFRFSPPAGVSLLSPTMSYQILLRSTPSYPILPCCTLV